MAVKKAQQSRRRLPSAQKEKTKGKERDVKSHPSRILTKEPGDNHLKHYGLETRTN